MSDLVGKKVKIIGLENSMFPNMAKKNKHLIGKKGEVKSQDEHGIQVAFGKNICWWFSKYDYKVIESGT